MKALRSIYQVLLPYRVRDVIFRLRTTFLPLPPPLRSVPAAIQPILDAMRPLTTNWHEKGNLSIEDLEMLAHYLGKMPWPIEHSLETGCGKSTILLSHISANHKVFTLTETDNSFAMVSSHPQLRRESLEVIGGPTQLTLPAYKFTHKLQFALIDGPHGYPFPDLEYYYIYPHLEQGALLVIDDIHIPNIHDMFKFLCADEMFTLLEVFHTTAVFQRTNAPTFDPLGDGWWQQGYNRDLGRSYMRKLGLREKAQAIEPKTNSSGRM